MSDHSRSAVEPPDVFRWIAHAPGRLIGRGHAAGDFLEAYEWEVLEEGDGCLRVRAHLPAQVMNPGGQMFGGFTATYVDLVSLLTVRAGKSGPRFRSWLATTNMRIDYFDPVTGPRFEMESRLLRKRGRMNFVEARFFNPDGALAVFALTTLREIPLEQVLGET